MKKFSPAALIFDMDDLLIRSATTWDPSAKRLIADLGGVYSEELSRKYRGMDVVGVAETIFAEIGGKLSRADCAARLRKYLVEEFGRHVEPMPGAVGVVKKASVFFPCAIASGSPIAAIEAGTEKLGIRRCFRVIVSSENVKRGKPAPDVFLAAARELGVEPAKALVFEDSLVGVRAAGAAGMMCVAVPSLDDPEVSKGAAATIPHLGKVVIDAGTIAIPDAAE